MELGQGAWRIEQAACEGVVIARHEVGDRLLPEHDVDDLAALSSGLERVGVGGAHKDQLTLVKVLHHPVDPMRGAPPDNDENLEVIMVMGQRREAFGESLSGVVKGLILFEVGGEFISLG